VVVVVVVAAATLDESAREKLFALTWAVLLLEQGVFAGVVRFPLVVAKELTLELLVFAECGCETLNVLLAPRHCESS